MDGTASLSHNIFRHIIVPPIGRQRLDDFLIKD